MLFANEAEIQALNETDDFENAVNTTAAKVGTLVVTRSEKGAVAVNNGQRYRVNAAPVAEIMDTTGAGDLFAAGFLTGYLSGQDMESSLTMGAVAAAEIISHYGARAEIDLKQLMADRKGVGKGKRVSVRVDLGGRR